MHDEKSAGIVAIISPFGNICFEKTGDERECACRRPIKE